MKNIVKLSVLGLVMSGLVGFALPALAATPVLSASQNGNNITLTITNADPYAVISLYERQTTSLWTTVTNFGTTDGNGYFSASENPGFDGSSNPLQLYVAVDGLKSPVVQVYQNGNGSGCSYNCGNPSSLSLSQTSLSLTSGQSSVVTAYTNYGSIYISSNSNSNVASASVSGDQITIYGQNSGSTTISVCQNSYSQCASIYVTVNGSGNGGGSLTFSNQNPNLSLGQSQYISIYNNNNNYNNNYYISSNSNSGIVSASISGSSLYIYGQQNGSSTISVCQSGSSYCGSLYVTVGSGSGVGGISLSTTSLNMTVGQTSTVNVYNNSGSVYLSNNSNQSVVSASISGQTISIYALEAGSATISVCQNNYGGCVSLYVVVTGNSGGSGSITFSPSNPTLSLGQSQYVNISTTNGYSYNNSYYISNNSNSAVVSASISGSQIYLVPQSYGNATISVCQSGYSSYNNNCGYLYVTVLGGGGYGSGLTFGVTNVSLSSGQSQYVTIYSSNNNNYSSGYYISSNSNSGVVSASVNGSSLYLVGQNSGSSTVTVCQSSYSNCGSVYVTVNGSGYYGNGSVVFSPSSVNLTLGQSSSVSISSSNGYYNYTITANTNSQVASAYISGSTMYLTGNNTGSTSFTVCQSSNTSGCGNLTVTVGNGYGGCSYYNNCGSGNLSLSQTSLSLSAGQSGSVTVNNNNYGSSYYISSNSNPSTVSASVSGSQITVYANQVGSSTISICQNGNSSICASLYVTVSGVMGSSTYQNGALIFSNNTVYIVYNNTETGFANASAFLGLGFKFSNVLNVGNSGLPGSGYTVSTWQTSHPWGSWIKSGSTVYFVSQGGLIPIPNWNTFLNNGGQAAWIVSANTWDFQLPVLSPMTYSDSRL